MIKKIILISGIMLSLSLFAESHSCRMLVTMESTLEKSIKKCKANDVLYWSTTSKSSFTALLAIAKYCHQEKEITTSGDLLTGVCTYVGTPLQDRSD